MIYQVDTYIGSLPKNLQPIANTIRELIFDIVPNVQEKLSFKVPFYHYFGMFCYINKVKDGLALCIIRGKDLLLEFPQLEQGNRATVASITLNYLKDISTLQVKEIIGTAAQWQQIAWEEKKPFVQKKK